ncbi:MAG TPA: anti-sigma factor [Jatrophihabitans sp.]|jgi:anti-sigma-K factor RskA|uniref:anti-sigma factor domain-containing protein n=1 Tax=Jatrophihabitans sp. TaxID=1932789 RepID=UPI002E01FD16|nr:anti-sigma factor [Jatrophihabitans sp.]
MNTHISDELPRLLTGEATRDVVLAASAHLRVCPDCQQELVSAVVAHASLTSAQRFAPEIVARDSEVLSDEDPDSATDATPLPDMSTMFAQVRTEAARKTHVAATAPRRRRLLAVAAAAAVLAGAGGVTYALTSDGGSSQVVTRQVALAAFGVGHKPATVTLIGDSKMKLDAASLPHLDKQHVYEVWLTNLARTDMQSVGFVGSDNTAVLPVSSNVMSHYKAIEVSVQSIDQTRYSGISVLRGTYG